MDLDSLSQKELAEFAYLLERQEEAHASAKLELYQPHKGQVDFHKSNAKIRLVVTGNRWGKTTASVIESAWLALGIHPYHPITIPNRGKLYGESFQMVDETFRAKFEEWIPKKFLVKKKPYGYNQWGYLNRINYANGSYTVINTYDQGEKKGEGSNWHYVGFDEPPRREIFVANLRGCVDYGGRMWFTCTPLSELWIYDDLWLPGISGQKKHVECFSGSIYDNPHLDKESVNLFVSELRPEEQNVRVHGRFMRVEGLVLSTYDPTLSDIDPFTLDHRFSIYEGIDPHPAKPHCALWKAIDPSGRRFVVGELACPDGIDAFGAGIAAMRRQLQQHGARLVRSINDTSLNQKDPLFRQNLRDQLISKLRELGEDIMPQNAQKRDWLEPGIIKLKDLYRSVKQDVRGQTIEAPMQYVFKNCTLYKHNLTHYQWPKPSLQDLLENARPIAKHNDFIDCDRYIESVAPEYQTPGGSIFTHNYSGAYTQRASLFQAPDTRQGIIDRVHRHMQTATMSRSKSDLSSPAEITAALRPRFDGTVSYRSGQRLSRQNFSFRGIPK
jgi:hypothetical protein